MFSRHSVTMLTILVILARSERKANTRMLWDCKKCCKVRKPLRPVHYTRAILLVDPVARQSKWLVCVVKNTYIGNCAVPWGGVLRVMYIWK